uniref:DM10 domain-containing protein n=1 Tax=Palpitomonas bilix TaxID=652834 RepID=A0A7S3G5F9_9EUKA|mmetsp:Transcript_20482/g.52613  ORF Transcript_20482/g.52613 Transcript_20482/m.52613 type:complete len:580 (+) Transcript_20482:80-1819(+)
MLLGYVGGVPQVSDPNTHRKVNHTLRSTVRTTDGDCVPSWVAFDRKVLRFAAYFKEGVVERPNEPYRVRNCEIFFYLEDNTIHVSERKTENSGIPQGVFLKRHRVLKEGSSADFYSAKDLRVGNEVTMYGRTFYIVGCDDFTRMFYEELGEPQPEGEDMPEDPYTTIRSNHYAAERPVGPPKPKDDDLVRYMEASLGLSSTRLYADKLAQFLANDRKVLRFYSYWDDTSSMDGEKLHYIIHFFLSDDTVEILERHKANKNQGRGRDPFPALLRRQKLATTANALFDYNKDNTTYYNAGDFSVGGTVDALGRKLFIYDCDAFTREYCEQELGIEQPPAISVKEPERPPLVVDIPPNQGFGTEEDSLGSFLYLLPRVPHHDWNKLMENDGKVLRFAARLTGKGVDPDRRFILSYFLSDDTIALYEPPQRNSGVLGGKFLERMRVKKPDSKVYYDLNDLYMGSTLQFFSHSFEVIDADEYTKKYLGIGSSAEGEAAQEPRAVQDVVEKVRSAVAGDASRLRSALRAADSGATGAVGVQQFVRIVEQATRVQVTDIEGKSLASSFGDGQSIMYDRFVAAIESS